MTLRSNVHIPGVPDDLAKKIAQARGEEGAENRTIEVANGQDVSSVLPVSTQITEECFDPAFLKVGQAVRNKGVYVGAWELTFSNGFNTGKKFDLYAAPDDLKDEKGKKLFLTFNDAVCHVAGLRNYHGYHGFDHDVNSSRPAEALYKALDSGDYKDEWFIPTLDILRDHLSDNRDQGALKGTFTDKCHPSHLGRDANGKSLYGGLTIKYPADEPYSAPEYWSCSRKHGKIKNIYTYDFTDTGKYRQYDGISMSNSHDHRNHHNSDYGLMSTRLVRAELRVEL